MNATQNPAANGDDADKSPDGEFPPIPDEDGPHDVPDDEVIEKTVPTAPTHDSGGS